MKCQSLLISLLFCLFLFTNTVNADVISAPFIILFSPVSILLLIGLVIILTHIFHTVSNKRRGDD
ncbi:MAG: hypothetical protein E7192_05370 [Erysipelotrichaceae bacterium]|nr:hypothetical protein [Erysipelotrichaceae bacterium]MBQ4343902.1 hypothetical protein [Erysipelotrichaceae bacterium]